ncbi:amino acid permease [Streptococcaceae bacterium ESL0687]|nr:amino acid permease [Streptococcaceae bacterium ESL0687]
MNIFRKKNLSSGKTEMKRHLRTFDLIFLGLGAVVGSGIFTITGIGAAEYAGPALVISIIIAALAVGISGLFFAEFASRLPVIGGPYGYLYAIFGEFIAWIAGWLVIMEFLSAVSGVASGWASYLKGLFHINLPTALSGPFDPAQGTYIDILPVLVILLVTGIVLMDSKVALRFNGALVALKFSALALFIIVGIFFIKPENWSNFSPYGWGSFFGDPSQNKGILGGAAIMFFAFLGYESIGTAADEAIEPQKSVPRGIGGALAIVALLYIVVTLILTGMVNYTKLNVADPLAFALRHVGMPWAANYISVVAILTLVTVCISMVFALARMIYGISRDGLLPKTFSSLTKKTKIPKNATLLAGFGSAVAAGISSLNQLAEFVNICTLAYLILLALGIIKLRHDKGLPEKGQFKTPLVPLLPIISIVICVSFMSQYSLITWAAFGITLLIATIIYFTYGYKHSELNKK